MEIKKEAITNLPLVNGLVPKWSILGSFHFLIYVNDLQLLLM